MPGAAALVATLAAAKVPMAVVTSSMSSHVALKRAHNSAIFDAMTVVVCVEDVQPLTKPHPRPFWLAAERLGLPASACVAVEDSLPGIRAAVAAVSHGYSLSLV